MSTPTVRKGRRKTWAFLATLAAAFGLFLTLGAGSASAAISCAFDADGASTGAGRITIVEVGSGADDSVTFKRALSPDGAILVNGAGCVDTSDVNNPVTATTTNTDEVIIDLEGGEDTVTIDNRVGRVTDPGATPDGPQFGLNDIEWEIANTEHFVFEDRQTAGAITVGEYGDGTGVNYDGPDEFGLIGDPDTVLINLNAFPADDDADVIIEDVDDDPATEDVEDLLEDLTFNLNAGDDFFTGKGGDGTGGPTDEPMTINGGEGSDDIEGGLGPDTITGGPGLDVLDGNLNPPVVTICLQDDSQGFYTSGSFGGDTVDLSGDTGPLTIVINPDGSITITPSPQDVVVGFENVIGTPQGDVITGNDQDNIIQGGGGNDVLSGGGGDDVLVGGDGDDTLRGDSGDDCVIGNAGNDILDENTGTSDTNPGNGNGADALDGGPGLEDLVTYGQRTTRVVVNLGFISWFNDGGDENADATSEECDDVFFSTENAITGSGNDILDADYSNNQADNEFTDGPGNDNIDGGAGNDVSHQGPEAQGSDVFEGGGGGDTMDYKDRTSAVNVTLDGSSNDGDPTANNGAGEGDNADGVAAFNGGPACADVNNIIGEGPFPEPFEADPFDEEPFFDREAGDRAGTTENVNGGSGNDILTGNDLGNALIGNAGNDTIAGRGGNDTLSGGDGTDWVDYQSAGAGGVGVQVSLVTNSATGEGTDTLSGFDNIAGSSFADNLRGDAGNNRINGRGGNDEIGGGLGNDVINGGPGVDELNGNGGDDIVRGQTGGDTIRGAKGIDRVYGDPGPDDVFGGSQNDRVFGGSGKDFLNGQGGTDRCRVGSPGLARGDVKIRCEL
jgi:Ca2+-binding RTX toxin-like protein